MFCDITGKWVGNPQVLHDLMVFAAVLFVMFNARHPGQTGRKQRRNPKHKQSA